MRKRWNSCPPGTVRLATALIVDLNQLQSQVWHPGVCHCIQGRSQPHSAGWARVPLFSFFLKLRSIFLTFPQTLLISFLILALRPPGKALATPLVSCQSQGWGLPPRLSSRYLLLLLRQKIAAMYLLLTVYIILVIFFHNQQTTSNSVIPRIFGENLKFGLFSFKIRKIQFFLNPDVIKTSL